MRRLKKNRAASFIAVSVVYVIASAVGVTVYNVLSLPVWLSLLIADIAATAATFVFSLIFANASVYDPYWSVQPIVIVTAFAAVYGVGLLQMLLIGAIYIWGVRLTANWAYTFSDLDRQDWRYTMIKEKSGKLYPVLNFVGIHLVPTLVVYTCVLPVVYTIVYKTELSLISIPFVLLSLIATALQGAADVQMHMWKRRPDRGTFIRVGLWKRSRHPNYLGEILMWWGIGLAAFGSFHTPWYLLGALLNTLLFAFVSIPLADGKQSKKDGFAEYKRETHVLLP